MNALSITLMAIGIPLTIAVPLILLLKGWDAWRVVPREIYISQRQRLFGLSPASFWIVSVIFDQIARLFKWCGNETAVRISEDASLAVLVTVLVYHLFWTTRIIRFPLNFDTRLVRFARYAMWGSAVFLFATAAALVENLRLR